MADETPISGLDPLPSAAQLTDIDPTVQSGTTYKRTNAQLMTLVNANAQLPSSAKVTGLDAQLAGQQPLNAALSSIAGLTTAADKMIYTTAANTYAVADLTTFARTLLNDPSAADARTTLELILDQDVQVFSQFLKDLADGSTATGNIFMIGDVGITGNITSDTFIGVLINSTVRNATYMTQKVIEVNSGSAVTLNPTTCSAYVVTLNAATPAITISGFIADEEQQFTFKLINGTGTSLPTFVGVSYAAGVAPTINQGVNAETILSVYWDGTVATMFAPANPAIGTVLVSNVPPGSAVSLASSNVIYDITSLDLPAGTHILSGPIGFGGGAVTATLMQAFYGTAPGNSNAGRDLSKNTFQERSGPTASADIIESMPNYKVVLSVPTTIYFKAISTYSGGTPTAYGTFNAQQVA